ncbi:hypothetical protein LSUE1_G010065 [Lachnellula suecica]|uniref:Thioesterase domain-containing protein n=1 Tax=Lachnellula suecica TaxID=602035 RepID=A0A8T9BT18_9HELO|nr:hypothetical protein LSUE1_G010065 [Lachnellula suecica]
MENVKIIDASPEGTVTFDFTIDKRYANQNGVVHGGAAGVIFDMCTTTALGPLAKPGFWERVGTTVRIHSVVMQVGRTMALIRGTMSSQDGKTVYCTCEHHKVAVPTLKENLEQRVEWDKQWDAKGAKL